MLWASGESGDFGGIWFEPVGGGKVIRHGPHFYIWIWAEVSGCYRPVAAGGCRVQLAGFLIERYTVMVDRMIDPYFAVAVGACTGW